MPGALSKAAKLMLKCLVFSFFVSVAVAEAAGPDLTPLQSRFEQVVRAARGDVGVTLIHVESGTRAAVNGDHRFPMASVYKLPIAVELLTQVQEGKVTLDRMVTLGPSDIRACCTLSRHHPHGGVALSVWELLELMMVESDNTAADAVLKVVGGPAVVQQRMRALGFNAINVNRYDGELNFEMTGVANPPPEREWTLALQYRLISEVDPATLWEARKRYMRDPRDTSTPDDMAQLLARLQKGQLLPAGAADVLLGLMAEAKTGPRRLKALLPGDTVVAHKTGTTDVVINDVGIISLPYHAGHLAMAVFVMNGGRAAAMDRTIADLSGTAYEFFTGKALPPPPAPKPVAKKISSKRSHRRRVPSKT